MPLPIYLRDYLNHCAWARVGQHIMAAEQQGKDVAAYLDHKYWGTTAPPQDADTQKNHARD